MIPQDYHLLRLIYYCLYYFNNDLISGQGPDIKADIWTSYQVTRLPAKLVNSW